MEQLIHQLQSNQIFTALSGAWALGVLTYLCRNIPDKLWLLFKRFCVTRISVTNSNSQFTDILEWLEKNGHTRKMHSLKLCEGKDVKDRLKTIGYGKHLIWVSGVPVLLELEKEENHKSNADREILYMHQFGRKAHTLHNIVAQARRKYVPGKTRLFQWTYIWNCVAEIAERRFDSVFLNEGQHHDICTALDRFTNNKQWYLDKFVPYRLGILLYGAPGSGKTSLIKAIAAYLKRPIAILPVTELEEITQACITLPEDSILVIEDIDTAPACSARKNSEDEPDEDPRKDKSGSELTEAIQGITRVHLSNILNALDGISSAEGRILILTTNHRATLDPALIRPGRIDLAVSMDYVDPTAFSSFYKHFFNTQLDPSTFVMADEVTGAVLQQAVLSGILNAEEIRKRYTVECEKGTKQP